MAGGPSYTRAPHGHLQYVAVVPSVDCEIALASTNVTEICLLREVTSRCDTSVTCLSEDRLVWSSSELALSSAVSVSGDMDRETLKRGQ